MDVFEISKVVTGGLYFATRGTREVRIIIQLPEVVSHPREQSGTELLIRQLQFLELDKAALEVLKGALLKYVNEVTFEPNVGRLTEEVIFGTSQLELEAPVRIA